MTYVAVAYMGYHAFGSYVKSDLLATLPDSAVATIARFAISLNLVTTIPLQMHPTKNSLAQLFWEVDANDLPCTTYIILILTVFALSWGIAMVVNDLGTVLAYVGASTSTL